MPLFLFTCNKYIPLSSSAKLLYSIILNRMKLSAKNTKEFQDENGIFIYFSNASIMENINCSKNTATQILNELQQAGLIRKEYQKRGLPLKIYVNDVFEMHEKSNNFEKEHTYKPKQTFNPHSPDNVQKDVSFDVNKAEEIARKNRANFGSKKNKRRSVNSTF